MIKKTQELEENNSINLFFSVISQASFGEIKVFYRSKLIFNFKAQNPGPKTDIYIKNLKCIESFFLKGDLGWAEAYICGLWETKDLSIFLEWGARNFHSFSNYIRGKWYIILYLRFKHYLNNNSKKGSKKNIEFHYDLGNEFYKSWLDESMTYSSAIFENKSQKLFDAQMNKFKNLSKLCEIKENDEVLEIGCGWGAFSFFLAKTVKAKVTAITISKKAI